MANVDEEMPVVGPGFVSAKERALLAEAIELERGMPAQAEELEALCEWLTRSRANYILSEWVLAGRLTVWIENGTPVFRKHQWRGHPH